MTFGIWNDYNQGKIFVSKDFINNSNRIFSMTLDDHSPNTLMFSTLSRYNFWRNFINQFKSSLVYFENQEIKFIMYKIIKDYLSRI